MPRPSAARIAIAAGVVSALAAAAWYSRPPPPPPAPYALWRDGRIVTVRHCDPPAVPGHRGECAWLACAQAVTGQMVNPMEGRLRPLPPRPEPGTGASVLAGTIDYRTTLAQPPMRAFACRVRGATLLDARLLPGE